MNSKWITFLIIVFSAYLIAQELQIIYPKDSSYVPYYDGLTIVKWTGYPYSQLNFEYSTDNGVNWMPMEIYYFRNDTTFDWYTPKITSEYCKIKLSLKSDTSVYVTNNSPFTIYAINTDYISINEIKMWIGNNGMGSRGFYWSGGDSAIISAIYQDGLLWGGIVNGKIKVNGNTWRDGIQPGRILSNGIAESPLNERSKIFKIRADWKSLPDDSIRQRLEYDYNHWPIESGAPFDDVNEDGVFTTGIDKPKFIGDETLFYVANDFDTATTLFTYGSNPIGLEFQTTVFGFNRDDLKDVVFKKYKVINKSSNDITDMYFTYWADDDLGDPTDDYEGFDTTHNMGYVFNSGNYDRYCGNAPPAIGHMLIQGPIVSSSTTDSARYEDGWKNGYKNLGMCSAGMIFKFSFDYPINPVLGDYTGSIQYYNLMRGLKNNGENIINPINNQSTIWPLCGDPVQNVGWYEGVNGWLTYPGDRQYHVPTGPFNLAAGDTQEIVIAIPIARGTDNINSITKLRELAAYVQEFYNTEFVQILNTKETIAPLGYTLYQNYPNPFNPKTTIEYEVPKKTNVTIKIYDILGREVQTLVNNEEKVRWKYKVEFNASTLSSGVYFYRLQAGSFTQTKKMMVLK